MFFVQYIKFKLNIVQTLKHCKFLDLFGSYKWIPVI